MSREFQLADWLVTPDLNRISAGDRSVSIEPQVMDVLAFLAEHPGEVLSKERILQAIWRDTFVTDEVLTYSISELRKALGDDARQPRFIETIPRRGYRLIAPVHRAPAATSEAPPEGERGIKRGKRLKLIGIAAAVSIVVLALGVWFFGPSSALTESDMVLLGGIANMTGDPVFEGVLEAALAINLEQSPFLNLFPRERVREMLGYMNRSPEEPVTPAIAREICQRRGLKAFITGSITTLGRNYVISLEAVNAFTGEVIAREQVEANAKEKTLQALGQAASRLRGRLGESLPSIRKYDTPLEQATTESLEAFKAYSIGRRLLMSGRWLEAIAHYKRAVELDPDFASAYDDMSYCYRVSRKRELSAEAAQKAFSLRDRVTEYERRSIEVAYYMFTTEEMHKAIAVTEAMKSVYPRSGPILDVLAGAYYQLGLLEKAIANFEEAIRLGDDLIAPVDLAFVYLNAGRIGDAKELANKVRATDSLALRALLFQIAFLEGDAAALERQVEWARGRPDELFMLQNRSYAAAFQGRIREARDFNRRAIELAQAREMPEAAVDFAVTMARTEALMGNCRQALEATTAVLAQQVDWQTLARAAMALAICGEAERAESIADEIVRRVPQGTLANELWLPTLHACMGIAHRDAQSTLKSLEPTGPYRRVSVFSIPYLRGQAHLLLRDVREAAVEFQAIIDNRCQGILSPLYPLAHLGMARASALAGDQVRARRSYEDLFALWKDADPDLPVLQQARTEYARTRRQ